MAIRVPTGEMVRMVTTMERVGIMAALLSREATAVSPTSEYPECLSNPAQFKSLAQFTINHLISCSTSDPSIN